jgi:hypothetical protein
MTPGISIDDAAAPPLLSAALQGDWIFFCTLAAIVPSPPAKLR